MKRKGIISDIVLALGVFAALLFAPVSGAYASFDVYAGGGDDDKTSKNTSKNASKVSGKAPAVTIELIEEKAPRPIVVAPKSLVDSKGIAPFDESRKAKQDGFFYLIDTDKKDLVVGVSPSSKKSVVLDTLLDRQHKKAFMLSGIDLFSTQGGIDLTLSDGDSQDPALDGFVLSLKTAINLGMPELAISPEEVGMENPLFERYYNLGVSLGYAGFSLDANFYEKNGGINNSGVHNAYSGVDVGFSYRSRKWMTRVGLAEYTYTRSPYSILPDTVKRLYSLELGGAYAVSPWVSVSGGLKFMDYGDTHTLDTSLWGSQVYFGGRFSY